LHFHVLQYDLDSLNGLENKLAQFAAGSEFAWVGTGGPASEEEQGIARELSEFLAKRRMKLSVPPPQTPVRSIITK
jgi:hypothetical protein